MNIYSKLKEIVTQKTKTYYFLTGALTVAGLLFIATSLYFTQNSNTLS